MNKWDTWAEPLMTPQLISVQGFAFRGWAMSLLVACAPTGSHLSRFSRRSLRLALQSTARRNETDEAVFTITKKTNHSSNMLINGSFFTWAKILLSQPLFVTKFKWKDSLTRIHEFQKDKTGKRTVGAADRMNLMMKIVNYINYIY